MESINSHTMKPASPAQRARNIRLHALASSRLRFESQGAHSLRRVLGHVAVLESVERRQQDEILVSNFQSGESDEDDEFDNVSDDDDESLTSDSSSDSDEDDEDDEHGDVYFSDPQVEVDAEHLTRERPSREQDDFLRQLEEMTMSLRLADKACGPGAAKVADETGKPGVQSTEITVDVAEWEHGSF